MRIQQLVEHQDLTLKLLKQIKISRKTGADTVPPAFSKLFSSKINEPVVELYFHADKLNKFKEYYLSLWLRNDTYEEIYWTILNDYNQENTESISRADWPMICSFFQKPNQRQPLNLTNFLQWTPYLKNTESQKILIKEAEYQAQQQNWPFL